MKIKKIVEKIGVLQGDEREEYVKHLQDLLGPIFDWFIEGVVGGSVLERKGIQYLQDKFLKD